MRIGQANADPFIAAYAQRELGGLYQLLNEPAEAQHHLQAALLFLKRLV